MRENYIVTTQKADMHALSYQGIRAPDSFAQLEDLLRRRLGEEYARFLAKPVPNRPQGNRPSSIDWYTTAQGPAQRVLDLPAEEQRPLRERFRAVARHIGALADELAQAPENAKKTRGNILLLSLLCPGEEALYAVGGRPVCVNWGYGPGAVGVDPLDLRELSLSPPEPPQPEEPEVVLPPPPPPTPEPTPEPTPPPEPPPVTPVEDTALFGAPNLAADPPPPEAPPVAPIAEAPLATPVEDTALFGASDQAAQPPPPPPPLEEEPPRRPFRPNWWWLLPAALAVVAGFMLMLRMGYPSLQSLLNFKEPTEAQSKRERERQLNEALPGLWAKLEERAGECKVHSGRPGRKPPAPGATPPAPTDPPKPPTPAPTDPPKSDPAPPTPAPTDPPEAGAMKGPAMKIPKKPRTLAFLQGKWRCASGIRRSSDKKEIIYEFSFDDRGAGTAAVLQPDGSRCTGAAKGSLVRGRLRIEVADQVCPGGRGAYSAEKVDCQNQGSAALCKSDGSGGQWRCQFTKME